MTTFRVWAPVAQRVDVEVGGERIPLTAREGGWWSADVPAARPGSDYAFILDGGEPLPDPRLGQVLSTGEDFVITDFYELGYELNNRPAWVSIPLQGIRQLWAAAQG